jgi:hypothetical protein
VPIPLPEHPVPAGPLAVRYLAYELPPLRAGATVIATLALENAGTATWVLHAARLHLSYHWLDRLGNPIVWDGIRTPLGSPVAPGERFDAWLRIAAPMPSGPYRLVIDLVDEGRLWLAELGNPPLELDVDVLPLLDRRALSVQVGSGAPELVAATEAALAEQEEPLVAGGEAVAFLAPGCMPAPDWSRLVLDAHAEGYAAVAGSIAVQGGRLGVRAVSRELAPWAPGFGRSPGWSHPLLCPSLLAGLADSAPWTDPVAGLPALDPAVLTDPWLCDGRIRVAVSARALRRADRRPA